MLATSALTYRAIARSLKISVSSAHKYAKTELALCMRLRQAEVAEARELSLRRLDDFLVGLVAKIRAGDARAVMAGVRVEERRARLLGLDPPQRVAPIAVTVVKKPRLDLSKLSDATLAALLKDLNAPDTPALPDVAANFRPEVAPAPVPVTALSDAELARLLAEATPAREP